MYMMMPSMVAIARAALTPGSVAGSSPKNESNMAVLWWFAGALKIPNRRQGGGDDDEPSYLAPEQIHASTIPGVLEPAQSRAFFSRPTAHTIEHIAAEFGPSSRHPE